MEFLIDVFFTIIVSGTTIGLFVCCRKLYKEYLMNRALEEDELLKVLWCRFRSISWELIDDKAFGDYRLIGKIQDAEFYVWRQCCILTFTNPHTVIHIDESHPLRELMLEKFKELEREFSMSDDTLKQKRNKEQLIKKLK